MFLDENYLLRGSAARKLYEEVAQLPVLDPHNHADPQQIVKNTSWEDIWEVECATDHYVWELMRKCDVPEDKITGSASNKEKWMALANVMPLIAGNPVYEWLHLDLFRVFGIQKIVRSETAEEIWEETRKKLRSPEMRPQQLLEKMRVEIMCTTDDPSSDLKWHAKAEEELSNLRMLPTWRPDRAMNIQKPGWRNFVEAMGERYEEDTSDLEGFLYALAKSHDYFARMGCVASDHGIEQPYSYPVERSKVREIHKKAFSGVPLTEEEARDYKAFMLLYFGELNAEKNWVTQLHIGAVRDYRDNLFRKFGPDSGGDISTNAVDLVKGLRYFLNRFDGRLKIVLYVLDPTHLPTAATISRAFPNVNLGAAWWFNDSPFGMEMHLRYIATVDLLSNFAGMVTDSRKLLSFGSRTEMFRRVLCNVLGSMVDNSQIPYEEAKGLARRACYDRPYELFYSI